MLDGKLSYGIGNMLCTAGLRALSNGYRNIKDIIERVFKLEGNDGVHKICA